MKTPWDLTILFLFYRAYVCAHESLDIYRTIFFCSMRVWIYAGLVFLQHESLDICRTSFLVAESLDICRTSFLAA